MRNLLLSAFALVCLLPMNAQTINTRIYPAEKLAKVKAKADTPTYAPAIKSLMREADKAMNLTPPSVMDKNMVASSGDKHDYMSMGALLVARPFQTGRTALYPQGRSTEPRTVEARPQPVGRHGKSRYNFGNRLLFLRQRAICEKGCRFPESMVPRRKDKDEPELELRSDHSRTQKRAGTWDRHD